MPRTGVPADTVGTDPRPAHPPAPRKDPILTVAADGSLYLGKRKVTPENLGEELRKELAAAGTDTALVTPGTTSTDSPAASQACRSSPPRPRT